jgi:ferritin-like metal-binding protein YciE
MKFIIEHLKNLRELYVNQLQMLLSAEDQIFLAWQDMARQCTDPELRSVLDQHLDETQTHAARLTQILTALTGSAKLVRCKVAHALVSEMEDLLLDARNYAVRDVALIAAAQRIEHYEIAAYGTVRHFAEVLGDTASAHLLDQTIKEEGETDHLLTEIAERLNQVAKQAA